MNGSGVPQAAAKNVSEMATIDNRALVIVSRIPVGDRRDPP
jgi:hypothetical protein